MVAANGRHWALSPGTFNCALNSILRRRDKESFLYLIQQDLKFSFPEFYDNQLLSSEEKTFLQLMFDREVKVMGLLFEHCLSVKSLYSTRLFPCLGRNEQVCCRVDSLYHQVFEEVCSIEFEGREDYFMLCGGHLLPTVASVCYQGEVKTYSLFDLLVELLKERKP